MPSTAASGADGFLRNLPVDLASIEEARQGLAAYLLPFQLGERVMNRIEVVLEELVSNVVRHASAVDELSIAAECLDDGVHLTIADNGTAFDPLGAAAPTPFSTLEEAELGGLGILLVKRLTRSLDYERIGGVNRIRAVVATQ